jgi:hypothetical protein
MLGLTLSCSPLDPKTNSESPNLSTNRSFLFVIGLFFRQKQSDLKIQENTRFVFPELVVGSSEKNSCFEVFYFLRKKKGFGLFLLISNYMKQK